MKWEEIRSHYLHNWLLVEAIKAHSDSGKCFLDQISVISIFSDSVPAMNEYKKFHRESPKRELYVFHSDRKQIDVTERAWIGIRGIQ